MPDLYIVERELMIFLEITFFSGKAMLEETLLMTETQCRVCGVELPSNGADNSSFLTDGTAEQSCYCAEHVSSYMQVCIECCGVYTANPGGVCQYCLETGSN
jgi:hypothetical protein